MSLGIGILESSRSVAPSASLLLDTYPGAAAAYSLRKLRTLYIGSAIRVRRSSDNTETNIGFNGVGELDTTALTLFLLGSTGRVVTWYDQSGNNRNASVVAANAPLIAASGIIYTNNGKPSVYYEGSVSQRLVTATFTSPISQPITSYSVTKVIDATGGINASVIYDSNSTNRFVLYHGGSTEGNNLLMSNGTAINIQPSVSATQLISVVNNTTNTNVFVNGIQKITNQNSGTNSLEGLTIGNIRVSAFYSIYDFFGWISELVFYPLNQTGNNTNIQNNINSFYTIY